MTKYLAVGTIALCAASLSAAATTYGIRQGSKQVAEFHAEDTYDAFDGRTSDVTGTIVADPAAPSSASVQVTIDLASLQTGVSLRDKEMRDLYLETAKFPAASFRSLSVNAPPAVLPNQPAEISVTGDFAMHGVTRKMTIPVRVVLIPGGRLHVTSRFKIKLTDFAIKVPHNVLVTVDDSVPVRLDLWATAQ